ncbi:L-aspartate oxidase [Haloimpatiens sp. FM7330]|uniref:L-aspartate oxidase n=1 Tax=Haloimpatiens sp. FM7330 TaxID=3298610 RepID=UPI0036426F3C
MYINTDVLIIGSGVAGLYAALNLRKDIKVTVLCKSKADECNTYLAQGGISTALNKNDIEPFVEDTLKAGKFKNDENIVRILAKESIENILKLENLGVNFDKNQEEFDYTREGAHRVNRIVHFKDHTGKRVFEVLYDTVLKQNNIEIIENSCLVDLVTCGNRAVGGIVLKNNAVVKVKSKVIIMATGGIGAIFKNSTNQKVITGDGIAIAVKNNIKVKNLNYIQFHPTGLYEKSSKGRRFLISESVRGEGAKLINVHGSRFIDELLPRDVVSRAILEEQRKTDSEYVYLDISSMSKEFIINRFPSIYEGCLERGIDITEGKIPVTPVQHYFMGGIEVDKFGRTSMKNLFACGEVSCTGVHGANRLASNSLLEGLVFSRRVASYINKYVDKIQVKSVNKNISLEQVKEELKLNKKIVFYEFNKVLGDKKHELASCR